MCIFAFAAWATTAGGGVIAGLAISGFVMASTSSAASLMQVGTPMQSMHAQHDLCLHARIEQAPEREPRQEALLLMRA